MTDPAPSTQEELRKARREYEYVPLEVKQRVVLQYADLVHYVVHRIAQRLPNHIDLEDLYNVGVIGLLDAIEKYDPDKNCTFKTYAEFRIKGSILDELRQLDWASRAARLKGRKIAETEKVLERRLQRRATQHEVAQELGVTIDVFHKMLRKVSIETIHFLQLEISDPYSRIEDERAENPLAELRRADTREAIREAVQALPEKMARVVALYYYEDLNMKEVGQALGISESRVCQIHTQAVGRLRVDLRGVDRGQERG